MIRLSYGTLVCAGLLPIICTSPINQACAIPVEGEKSCSHYAAAKKHWLVIFVSRENRILRILLGEFQPIQRIADSNAVWHGHRLRPLIPMTGDRGFVICRGILRSMAALDLLQQYQLKIDHSAFPTGFRSGFVAHSCGDAHTITIIPSATTGSPFSMIVARSVIGILKGPGSGPICKLRTP